MGVQAHLTEHQVINPATHRTAQHISTENLLNDTVSPLSLAIRLGVVGHGMKQRGPQPGEQLLPEAAPEAGVPVSNDRPWHAILVYHPLEEQVSRLGGSDGVVYRDKRDTLGGSIHHSHCKGLTSLHCPLPTQQYRCHAAILLHGHGPPITHTYA